MDEHLQIILRSIIAFSLLFISAKFLGKQTISKMTNFDFIATISLGSIVANLTFNTSVKIHHLALAFTIFVIIIYSSAFLSMKSRKARKFLAGDPTIVIENGKILENNMRKMRYTFDYLNQQLQEKDIFNIHEVLFAILEANGTLTVLKKPQYRTPVIQDLHMQVVAESRLPIELIMDGKIVERNLEENQLSLKWLKSELNKKSVLLNDVAYAVLAGNGVLYVDTFNDHILSPIDKE
ncbi:DUF421 domain-containing protein [Bacillus sp. 31A1R]|uniref:DUF421 domain-containing protein n=1 Tax=Robertmurraya mangrovi TaxID=3098077 RepID=A0ABU5IVQ9_9BACI|nr:DUF421 domain-containing protein [Bacillus sp. 31A1R]MDZ5471244.1 DUF421 domain-containing protein [Bacillus sp. 31A1R]